MTYENAREILEKNGQEHVLRYYEELSESERRVLLDKIGKIDFSVIDILKKPEMQQVRGKIEPLSALQISEIEEIRKSILHLE